MREREVEGVEVDEGVGLVGRTLSLLKAHRPCRLGLQNTAMISRRKQTLLMHACTRGERPIASCSITYLSPHHCTCCWL